jgi:glutamate-1-semialdehyde 2,1-aminomutase
MLAEDIYFAPSAYEAGFMSSEHSEDEIDTTIAAAEKVFKNIKN